MKINICVLLLVLTTSFVSAQGDIQPIGDNSRFEEARTKAIEGSKGQLTTDAENYCAFVEEDGSGDAVYKFVLKGADGEFYSVATAVPKAGAAKVNYFRKLNGGGGANSRCAKIYPAWVKPSAAPAPAPSTAPTEAPTPSIAIAGGFTDDKTVPNDIINFITTTFPAYQGADINCSASQVVAGTNYKVIITKDDASYEVGVFQPLPGQGSLQITSDPTPVTDVNAACTALTSPTAVVPVAPAPEAAAVVPSAGEVDVFAPAMGPSMTITPEEIEAMFPTPAKEPAAAPVPAPAPAEEEETVEEVLATGGAVGAKVAMALVAGLLVFLF